MGTFSGYPHRNYDGAGRERVEKLGQWEPLAKPSTRSTNNCRERVEKLGQWEQLVVLGLVLEVRIY